MELRASGKLLTAAQWMREQALTHPGYARDSRVSEEMCYDLIHRIEAIRNKVLRAPRLLGEFLDEQPAERAEAEDGDGNGGGGGGGNGGGGGGGDGGVDADVFGAGRDDDGDEGGVDSLDDEDPTNDRNASSRRMRLRGSSFVFSAAHSALGGDAVEDEQHAAARARQRCRRIRAVLDRAHRARRQTRE